MKKTFILTALFLLSACGDRALVSKSELQDLRNAQNELKEELRAEKNKPAPAPASTSAPQKSPTFRKIGSVHVQTHTVNIPDRGNERVILDIGATDDLYYSVFARLLKLVESAPYVVAYKGTEEAHSVRDLHLSARSLLHIKEYVSAVCGVENPIIVADAIDRDAYGSELLSASYTCYTLE